MYSHSTVRKRNATKKHTNTEYLYFVHIHTLCTTRHDKSETAKMCKISSIVDSLSLCYFISFIC